jgi:hypothetical protein
VLEAGGIVVAPQPTSTIEITEAQSVFMGVTDRTHTAA